MSLHRSVAASLASTSRLQICAGRASSAIVAAPLRIDARATTCSRRSLATGAPKDPLIVKLQSGLKDAMRAKDSFRAQVLKSALADIQTLQHQETPPATVQTLLSSLSKRKEAIKSYAGQNRDDLVQQFHREITVLEEFVPEDAKELSLEELSSLIEAVMQELNVVKGDSQKGSLASIIKEVKTRAGIRATNLGRELAESVKKALAA